MLYSWVPVGNPQETCVTAEEIIDIKPQVQTN